MAFDSQKRSLFSTEAEQYLLGAILFDNAVLEVIPEIRPEDFAQPIHGKIFEAVLGLVDVKRSAAPITVATVLSNDASFKDIGGNAYLERLAANFPSIAGAADYASTVREYSMRRRLDAVAADIAEIAGRNSYDFDASKAVEEASEMLASIVEERGSDATTKSMREALSDWLDRHEERRHEKPGFQTGIGTLDDKITFRPGKLYIIAGRPGMGKSTLLNKIAAGIAETHGVGVAISTLEMEAADLPVMLVTDKMRDMGIRLPYTQAENGIMSVDEFEAFSACGRQISDLPIEIDDTPAASIAHIRWFARKMRRRFRSRDNDLGALVVDYLGLIEKSRDLKGTDRVAEITQGLLRLAKEMHIPIIVGCQLNREVERRDDKRPLLSDLRESGDIEQDAFAVLFVYRDIYYHERCEPKKGIMGSKEAIRHEEWEMELLRLKTERPLEVIIAKHRRGPTCTVQLWCEIETAAIRDRGYNPADPMGRDTGGFL